jgi:hypothetical protein
MWERLFESWEGGRGVRDKCKIATLKHNRRVIRHNIVMAPVDRRDLAVMSVDAIPKGVEISAMARRRRVVSGAETMHVREGPTAQSGVFNGAL